MEYRGRGLEEKISRRRFLESVGGIALGFSGLVSHSVYGADRDIRIPLAEALYEASLEALYLAGFQGGYVVSEPKRFRKMGNFKIPYYYDRGEFFLPKLSEIEKEISAYIDNKSLEKFSKKTGLDHKGSKIKTSADIEKGKVVLDYDLKVVLPHLSSEGVIVSFNSNFNIPLKSKLAEMYEIAKWITDSNKEDPEWISITTLSEMAEERNLYVNILNLEGKNEKGETVALPENLVKISALKEGEKFKRPEDVVYPPHFYFLNRYKEK